MLHLIFYKIVMDNVRLRCSLMILYAHCGDIKFVNPELPYLIRISCIAPLLFDNRQRSRNSVANFVKRKITL